jgi:hypothetical protein
MGSSPARLEAFALKMRVRMPRSASQSTRRWASGRLAAVWILFSFQNLYERSAPAPHSLEPARPETL